MRSWVLWNILRFIGTQNLKTYRKDCTLCWDVYIICICNVLILLDYCVNIKNKLHATFASLGIEVVECSILSGIIV
jgi:hypothetical protein